jgi:hypothetical protein
VAAPLPDASTSAGDTLHDVVRSTPFLVARNLTLFLLACFWLATIAWVLKDARRRIDDPFLRALAVLVGALPLLGPPLYVLLRPPEYLADARERSTALRVLELEVAELARVCPACAAPVRAEFVACPLCAARLRERCRACAAPVEPGWRACPHCAAALGATPELVEELLARARPAEPEPGPSDVRAAPEAEAAV